MAHVLYKKKRPVTLSERNNEPTNIMNIEDHILALVARKFANEASEKELKELEELLQQHPDIHDRVKLLSEWWQSEAEQSIEASGYFRFQKIVERI